jgi:hypothetical protein
VRVVHSKAKVTPTLVSHRSFQGSIRSAHQNTLHTGKDSGCWGDPAVRTVLEKSAAELIHEREHFGMLWKFQLVIIVTTLEQNKRRKRTLVASGTSTAS